jgi:hypothetical protein
MILTGKTEELKEKLVKVLHFPPQIPQRLTCRNPGFCSEWPANNHKSHGIVYDNIKCGLKQIVCAGVKWIQLDQDWLQ